MNEEKTQIDRSDSEVNVDQLVRQFYQPRYKTELKDWIYHKVEDIKRKIGEHQTELKKYEAIQRLINSAYCKHCNGEGFTREYYDINEFNTKDCKHCNKTGLVKSA